MMMTDRLTVIDQIQSEKARMIQRDGQPALNPEIIHLAKHKRDSFDVPINVSKVDPLR